MLPACLAGTLPTLQVGIFHHHIGVKMDAVPADTYLVEKLAGAFDDEKVDAAYARQLPNPDCSVNRALYEKL